ncbi:lipopolysaccharide biosynthesis protein [Vibrio splendidus]
MKKSNDKNTIKSVLSGMFTLLLGSASAKVLTLICIPVLTRLYSPDDYGVLAAYTSIVAILFPALNFRYVLAIPLPSNDKMAINILFLSIFISSLITILLSVLFIFYSTEIFYSLSLDSLNDWWFIVIIGALGSAMYELFSTWSARKKNYTLIAKTQFKQAVFGSGAKLLLGVLSIAPLGLIIGQVVTQSAGIWSFVREFYRHDYKLIKFVSWTKMTFVFRYFKGFLIYRFPSQFLMALASQAPILIMAKEFSTYETGQLSLAMMALAMPVGLMGQAVSKAYYAEIASLGKKNIGKIKIVTTAIQKKLFFVGVPVSIAIFFLGEFFFQVAFGSEWKLSGTFASILAPYILIQFTSSPLVQVLNVIGSQFHFLLINAMRLVGIAMIYGYIVINEISAIEFIEIISIWMFLFYLIITCVILNYVNKRSKC